MVCTYRQNTAKMKCPICVEDLPARKKLPLNQNKRCTLSIDLVKLLGAIMREKINFLCRIKKGLRVKLNYSKLGKKDQGKALSPGCSWPAILLDLD